VASLFNELRVHIVGTMEELEDQMVSWDPVEPDGGWSPDRMDAMVWAVSELMLESAMVKSRKTADRRLRGRR
jgi:phage terminase large subunit-like protein